MVGFYLDLMEPAVNNSTKLVFFYLDIFNIYDVYWQSAGINTLKVHIMYTWHLFMSKFSKICLQYDIFNTKIPGRYNTDSFFPRKISFVFKLHLNSILLVCVHIIVIYIYIKKILTINNGFFYLQIHKYSLLSYYNESLLSHL